MASVSEVARELRNSDLPAHARLVMFTLMSLADSETGIIHDTDSPSYSEIARMTGLARSTVALQIKLLEDKSWLVRTAPGRIEAWRDKDRNRYLVRVPTSPSPGLVRPTDQSDHHEPDTTSPCPGLVTSPGDGLVRPTDQCESGKPDGTSPGDGLALKEVLTVRTTSTTSSRSTSTSSQSTRHRKQEDRPDVEEICTYLADKIESNGSKRPGITDRWRQQARLLLDEPRPIPVDVDKVKRAIDWIQGNPFWQRNILSMPKLREQWDRIRLDATNERRSANARTQGGGRSGWAPYLNPENPDKAYSGWDNTGPIGDKTDDAAVA